MIFVNFAIAALPKLYPSSVFVWNVIKAYRHSALNKKAQRNVEKKKSTLTSNFVRCLSRCTLVFANGTVTVQTAV
jgi:hypothetical protein